jgi:hypothetical protein
MSEYTITVQRTIQEDDPLPHDSKVTVMRMTLSGRVSVFLEQGDKAERIAAGERAKALGFMVCFGD